MCGIAGYITRTTRADARVLEDMLGRIRYRGPDAMAGLVEDNGALGSVRLSIIDLAGGIQPAVSADRRVVIVFNGEIFNYLELRADLQARGHRFETRSEIETLLHLYLELGEEMVARIEGQFAIAVWDRRSDKLLLFRDRLGIRPLFWHLGSDGLTFGSEVKALAGRPGITLRPDRRAIVQSFRFWTMVGDTSPFEGIHQVPPGHYLAYENGEAALRRYWEWPLPGTVDPLCLESDEAYAEAFEAEFVAAVQRQGMADVPVASFLSGGIDSSAVAAVFQRQMGNERLRTYSVVFDDPEYNEEDLQSVVVGHAGFDHTSLRITTQDFIDSFREVIWHAEAPLYRAAATPLYLLTRKVHEDGIKVVQTGEGADEMLLGYDLFREAAIRRFWSRQPDSQSRGQLLLRLYHYLPRFRDPRSARLLLEFYRRTLKDTENPHFAMDLRWSAGQTLAFYFSPDMRSFADSYDPVSELEAWLPSAYWAEGDVARAQCIEVQALLSNYLLSSQGDRMSMAHSVEGRYPYLDDRFIAFCSRLPQNQKLRGLKDKLILRNACRGILPDMVRKRPKYAYHSPDIKAFVVDGRLPDYVEDQFDRHTIEAAGIFDPKQIERLRTKALGADISRMDYRDNMAFVLILSTMLLHDQFIRRQGVPSADARTSLNLA